MNFRSALLALVGLALMNTAFAGKGVVVSDAWVREGPPNAAALGGFMVVHNHTDAKKVLVKASANGFDRVELHRTMRHDGMMKMMHQERIVIPARDSIVFKPGDYHLMMMKPKKALKAGDHVMVTLGFANGTSMKVKYTVRKGKGEVMDHGKMNGGGHNMKNMKH